MTRSKLMLAGMFTLVLGLFSVLPADASAQGWWGNQDNNRRERRDDRRERRRERRQERRERRDDRRNDGVWNQGRYGGDPRWDGRTNQGRYGNYDNYPNYGGDYNSRQTALNAGYNEGIKEGREDRQRGEQFEYRDESDYRSATKDYNSRYGDRGIYQRYFREAFARGYNDGYRGY
ncbi:MAG TPA: hypothetical protein VIP46_03665 [Pyrinomonadaceae bacterium]